MAKRRLLGDRGINPLTAYTKAEHRRQERIKNAVDMGRAVRTIEAANEVLNNSKVCVNCGDNLFKLGEATLHMSTNAVRCNARLSSGLTRHFFEAGPDGKHCKHCGWHRTIHEKFGPEAVSE